MTSVVEHITNSASYTVPAGFIFIGSMNAPAATVRLQGLVIGSIAASPVTANGLEVFSTAASSAALYGKLYDITAFAESLVFNVTTSNPYTVPAGFTFVGRATGGSGIADAVILEGVQIGNVGGASATDTLGISADAGMTFTAGFGAAGYVLNGLLIAN